MNGHSSSSRRRKTLSPTRVAALLRESHKILGELRENDDENSPPLENDETMSSDTPRKEPECQEEASYQQAAAFASSKGMTRLHGSVSCFWERGGGKALDGELWVSDSCLHWSPSPMGDITNRGARRDSSPAPLAAGLRLASPDVAWIRSVQGKRPTIEVKLTNTTDPVVLTFHGPGSVSAAMAAVETYPTHLYQDKASVGKESVPCHHDDHNNNSEEEPPVAAPSLESLVREFMTEPRQSNRSRAIAKEVHALTAYPLLPFGVAVTSSCDAEPLPQRDAPLTDPQKRSLIMALLPLYDSVNRAKNQAAKDSEALINIRAERSEDGSYRYIDMTTQKAVSPNTYRTRYLEGLAITGWTPACAKARNDAQEEEDEEMVGAGVKQEEEEEVDQEMQAVQEHIKEEERPAEEESLEECAEKGITLVVSPVVEQEGSARTPDKDASLPVKKEVVEDEEELVVKEVEVPLREDVPVVTDSEPTSLEEMRSRAQKRLFEAFDAALHQYHQEIADAEAAFAAAATR